MRTPVRHSKCPGIQIVAAIGLGLGLSLGSVAQSLAPIAQGAPAWAASLDARTPQGSLAQFLLRNPNDDPLLGEGMPGQLFGTAMALEGDTLVVGAWSGGDDQGRPTGAVYVFRRVADQWVRHAKLVAPDAAVYDAFGAVIALEGDRLIVGAPNYSRAPLNYQGAAYVFVRDALGWHFQQKLLETTQQSDAHFGAAIALNQNRLAVSANHHDVGGLRAAGVVSLFESSDGLWQLEQEITAPAPIYYGEFGTALCLLDNELFVGADGEGFQSGAACVFARDNDAWTSGQRLVPQVSTNLGLFGMQIAGNAERVLISSPADRTSADGPGKVIEWRRIAGQWVEGQTLDMAMLPGVSKFGRRLNYRAGRWLVGAEYLSAPQTMLGVELFVYEEIAGTLTRTQQISLPYAGDASYGLRSLASSADQILVGLPTSFAFPYASAGEVRIYNSIPQEPGAQLTLNTGGTAAGEHFGAALAADRDWLLVGTPYERRRSATAGAVFAYPREPVDQVAPTTLYANDAQPRDRFGSALALSNDTFLVGAPGNAGAVYHFAPMGSEWMQIAKWPAPTSSHASLFGNAIAADANRAVVGAEREPIPDSMGSGVAYVYERSVTGWDEPVRLQVSDATSARGVGMAVATDQDTIVLGAVPVIVEEPFGVPGLGEGAAYVFIKNGRGWVEQAKLVRPPDEEPFSAFGLAVALSGDTLFVGAPRLQQVHVFQRQGSAWSWLEMLSAPPGITAGFGTRLSVMNGQLWVGSETDVADIWRRGSLHRYQVRDGYWRLLQSFAPSGAAESSWYATSFTAFENILYVGAPGNRGHLSNIYDAGAVFVHELPVFADDFEN